MSFTVQDLLQLDCMVDCNLRAGTSGVDRVIRWVNIQEVLDCLELLNPGELLITTGYGLNTDLELQSSLIAKLHQLNLSGLAIQTGFYLEEIPQPIMTQADYLQFPVIELPKNASFRTLTEAMLRQIIGLQNRLLKYSEQEEAVFNLELRLGEAFLSDLLAGNLTSAQMISDRALPLGIDLNKPQTVGSYIWQATDPALREKILAITTRHVPDGIHRYLFPLGTTQLIVLINAREPEAVGIFEQLHTAIKQVNTQIYCGVSGTVWQPDELPGKLLEANEAASIALTLKLSTAPTLYSELGIYRLLFPLQDSPVLQEFYTQTVKPLVDYDQSHQSNFLHTLESYYQFDKNSVETAKALYLHRHTLAYRLTRIEQLTGLNPRNPQHALRLQLGILAFQVLNQNS